MKPFVLRPLVAILCVTSLAISYNQAFASAFQIWEQDAANIGQYHAGYAALAMDASTAFYNPAGMTRLKRTELIAGVDPIMTDFKYRGVLGIEQGSGLFKLTKDFPPFTDQGGLFAAVPFFYFVTPINDCVAFGFDANAPFGLKTNYGKDTPMRFAATLSSLTVVNTGPTIAFKVTDKASLGVGLDVQRVSADFNSFATLLIVPDSDTESKNQAKDTACGFHLGALYEFDPCTRAGVSFHSQVVHHLEGTSTFKGPVADLLNEDQPIRSRNAKAHLTLPAFTAFSIYHRILPQVALMGSAVYTKWDVFKELELENVAGAVEAPFPVLIAPSTNILVSIPQNYRNTWNFSVGTDYYATKEVTVRAGIGYDETPLRNKFRTVQLPDSNRYVIALGGHFQALPCLGLDLGWSHFFTHQVHVNPPPQVTGGQTVTTNGRVKAGADAFGAQVVWTI